MGLHINIGGGDGWDNNDENYVNGNSCSELIEAGLFRHVEVLTESGWRKLVRNCDPPEGYIWNRSPFGTQQGWKATIVEEPEIAYTDTQLEQDLRDHLQSWGYWKHFKQDCRKLGRQLDFADVDKKVALEPGAVYFHTPDSCQGEAVDHVGESPQDVYFPTTSSDQQKQRTLEEAGWRVLWMTEEGVRDHSQSIRKWLSEIYDQ